jgi:hypothetical protein
MSKIADDLEARARNLTALDAWYERNPAAEELMAAAERIRYPKGRPKPKYRAKPITIRLDSKTDLTEMGKYLASLPDKLFLKQLHKVNKSKKTKD